MSFGRRPLMPARRILWIALAVGLVFGCGHGHMTAPTGISRQNAPPAAVTQIVITRSELNNGGLRVEGNGAVPNHAVTVDGGAASGVSDGAGAFRIEKSPFSSPTCRITVADGTSSAQATLSGCTPAPPPPPPAVA